MSKRVFLVELGEKGPGYTLDKHAVVIEAELDDEGRFAKVVAPAEFASNWPSVLVPGSTEWTECNGPARILPDLEYTALCVQLLPTKEYKSPKDDPGWVVADSVEAAVPDGTYVNVTYQGKTFNCCCVGWHNMFFDKTKSDVTVEDPRFGWLRIEFKRDDIKPYVKNNH